MYFYSSEIQFVYNEALEATSCTGTHGEEMCPGTLPILDLSLS